MTELQWPHFLIRMPIPTKETKSGKRKKHSSEDKSTKKQRISNKSVKDTSSEHTLAQLWVPLYEQLVKRSILATVDWHLRDIKDHYDQEAVDKFLKTLQDHEWSAAPESDVEESFDAELPYVKFLERVGMMQVVSVINKYFGEKYKQEILTDEHPFNLGEKDAPNDSELWTPLLWLNLYKILKETAIGIHHTISVEICDDIAKNTSTVPCELSKQASRKLKRVIVYTDKEYRQHARDTNLHFCVKSEYVPLLRSVFFVRAPHLCITAHFTTDTDSGQKKEVRGWITKVFKNTEDLIKCTNDPDRLQKRMDYLLKKANTEEWQKCTLNGYQSAYEPLLQLLHHSVTHWIKESGEEICRSEYIQKKFSEYIVK